jgi:hypothetical protein
MEKQLFVVNSGFELDNLVLEVRAKGGRPIELFPPSYLIAEVFRSGSIFNPPTLDDLDLQARTAVQTLRRAKAPAAAPSTPLSWDTPGKEAPRVIPNSIVSMLDRPHTAPMGSPVSMSTGTPTSRFLIGRVAIALVIVSREHGIGTTAFAEHLTLTERDNAAVEATDGLGWLATLEPRASVEFAFERHDLELTVIQTR